MLLVYPNNMEQSTFTCLTCDNPAKSGHLHCAGENKCDGMTAEDRYHLSVAMDAKRQARWEEMQQDAWEAADYDY